LQLKSIIKLYICIINIRLYEKNGIKFLMNKSLSSIDSKFNTLYADSIKYTDNTLQETNLSESIPNTKISFSLETDMVILGTGVNPNTDLLESVVTLENNFCKCDAYLSTSDKNIYSAGDIVTYPSIYNGERIHSLHYVNAQQQGAIAALNMMGKNIMYDYIPFFSVRLFDKSLQYVGYSDNYDNVFIEGNLEEFSFLAYYIKNNKVVAFACMNKPNAANIIYESFRNNLIPSAEPIKKGELNIDKLKVILKNIKPRYTRAECICANRIKI
jgi:NADPH-dependent 2,4-dienoyl-CoA reductase/sulfur reductase-like enzyme